MISVSQLIIASIDNPRQRTEIGYSIILDLIQVNPKKTPWTFDAQKSFSI